MQAGNKGVCRRVREGPEVGARLREASIFTATDPPREMRNDLISLDFADNVLTHKGHRHFFHLYFSNHSLTSSQHIFDQ